MSKPYVIIGASAAGIAVVNKLARLKPDAKIICITAQKEPPYNKCLLADYLAGNKQEQEIVLSTVFAQNNTITFKPETTVSGLDATNKIILCSDGQQIDYECLFLGMGGNPYIPEFLPSVWYPGIFTFQTLADANAIQVYIWQNKVKSAVVIGAGLSGLECADVLQKKGITVTLIERQQVILPQLEDKNASAFLQQRIEQGGGTILCNQNVVEVQGGANGVAGVLLATGKVLPTDMLVLATGLRSNNTLAQQAGIAVCPQGIIVNTSMQTSLPEIYAGGDAIAITNTLTQGIVASCNWPDAMLQGIHAAHAMAGIPKPYLGVALITSTAFFGLHLAYAGFLEPQPGDELIIKESYEYYHRFIVRDGVLKGFSVLGNVHNLGTLRRLIMTGQPFDLASI